MSDRVGIVMNAWCRRSLTSGLEHKGIRKEKYGRGLGQYDEYEKRLGCDDTVGDSDENVPILLIRDTSPMDRSRSAFFRAISGRTSCSWSFDWALVVPNWGMEGVGRLFWCDWCEARWEFEIERGGTGV